MKKIPYYISFVLLLVSVSCVEKEINYDYNGWKTRIVVTGTINPEMVEVYLQNTIDPQNSQDDRVIGASVYLQENWNTITYLNEQESGHFISDPDLRLKYDVYYNLMVVTLSGDTLVSNQEKLLYPVQIDSCYVKKGISNKDDSYVFMIYKDPLDQENFYYYTKTEYSLGKVYDPYPFNKYAFWHFALSDELFAGQSRAEIEEIELEYFSGDTWIEKDSVKFQLFSYSRTFAEYLNSIGDNKYVNGDVLYEQPLFVKSFITNGFGIFGSYAVDDYILHLK